MVHEAYSFWDMFPQRKVPTVNLESGLDLLFLAVTLEFGRIYRSFEDFPELTNN